MRIYIIAPKEEDCSLLSIRIREVALWSGIHVELRIRILADDDLVHLYRASRNPVVVSNRYELRCEGTMPTTDELRRLFFSPYRAETADQLSE